MLCNCPSACNAWRGDRILHRGPSLAKQAADESEIESHGNVHLFARAIRKAFMPAGPLLRPSRPVVASPFMKSTGKKLPGNRAKGFGGGGFGGLTKANGGGGGGFGGLTEEQQQQEVPGLRYLGDDLLMRVQPSVPDDEIGTDACRNIVTTLRLAMKKYSGIGIAAPQIGLWTRIFVFGMEANPRYPKAKGSIEFQAWINPEITWSSDESNWMWEGCLSVPGMRGWVERPKEVRLRGFDENGNEREVHLIGLPARIAQHELDHLDGVLFPHRTPGTKFVVPQNSLDDRDTWASDWPSPGSRRTESGDLSDEF